MVFIVDCCCLLSANVIQHSLVARFVQPRCTVTALCCPCILLLMVHCATMIFIMQASTSSIFSIASKNMIRKSINFSFRFWTQKKKPSTNVRNWHGQKGKPPPFHFLNQNENANEKKIQWHKITIYMRSQISNCCQKRFISSSSSSSNIVLPHKHKTEFIDYNFHYTYILIWLVLKIEILGTFKRSLSLTSQ